MGYEKTCGVLSALALMTTAPTAYSQAPLTEVAELRPGSVAQSAGFSVAISGERIAMGAPTDDTVGSNAGAVYVFLGTGGIWGEESTVTADLPTAGDQFGFDVLLFGDTLIVGAPFDDEADTNAGAVYVFSRTGSAWTQEDKLMASDASSTSEFGRSLAVDGDWLLIGAPDDDATANDAGATYVFQWTGTAWSEQAILRHSGGGPSDLFGTDVDIDGTLAVIGTPGENAGILFGRVGTTWIEGPRLSAPTGNGAGRAVGISGDRVVIGLSQQVSVRVYERSGSAWPAVATLTGTAGFGSSLQLDGDILIVGAPGSRRFHRFEKQATQWVSVLASPEHSFSEFGGAVAASNTTVVGGTTGLLNVAVVFELSDNPLPDFCFGDGGDQMGCFPCPCGNDATVGTRAGCTNSTGFNCRLRAKGIPSVSNDSLEFDAEGVNILTFALLLSADNQLPQMGPCPAGTGINTPLAPLDGLRCIGGNLLRHGTRASDFDGNLVSPWGGSGGPPIGLIAQGSFVAGQTRQFQVIYREFETLGCFTALNTSNGLTATFIP